MNIQKKLEELTGQKWQVANGPNSGSGVDFWFINQQGEEAWANYDQGYVTISVNMVKVYGEFV